MKYTRGKNPGSQSKTAIAKRTATQKANRHPWRGFYPLSKNVSPGFDFTIERQEE